MTAVLTATLLHRLVTGAGAAALVLLILALCGVMLEIFPRRHRS